MTRIDNLDDMVRQSQLLQPKIASFFSTYQPIDKIYLWLSTDIKNRPSTNVSSYGESEEGHELLVVNIGKPEKPTILVDCGMHAREWISVSFWKELKFGIFQSLVKSLH